MLQLAEPFSALANTRSYIEHHFIGMGKTRDSTSAQPAQATGGPSLPEPAAHSPTCPDETTGSVTRLSWTLLAEKSELAKRIIPKDPQHPVVRMLVDQPGVCHYRSHT
jgi:hypothetical protein